MTRVFSDLRPAGMNLDDAMRLCARGEQAGLRAIYDLEAPAMIGVAMRILRRRDLAEEAVHDCIVQVWRKAASFDAARGQARAWLYTVLRNRALNILRGERQNANTGEDDLLALESDIETPEACVTRLSDEKALRRCLERLEPIRRNMIVLAFAQGLTHGELAGKLGLPLGTVKSTIRRSLAALKECMA